LAIDGAIRQVVEAAEGGIYVHPGDPGALAESVRELAGDRDRCARMGRAARAYVEAHFERSQQAGKLEALLTTLTRGRARSS
jgi:glycosyltransferase involved in cell wall biosynthesis